ncbi:MAG: hypothetical protein HWQ38_12010 [Nostoc sp. NMS7]|uniref:hypothetical protein n=1 Tax=Nostoc sp. NMS7 TaxID=2815391 RepID=UPI0025F4DDD9|nr:hypothetical protein [Nostoc sp. NMS7]MBN3947154.1 hypothetical protein [Nostoc sp. NMS7]
MGFTNDPVYQQQWADMEKHSPKALPELFTGKQQVWGLHLEPLGDYVDAKIVPFPSPQTPVTPNQSDQTQPVTIDKLRDWYSAADKLNKPDEYKKRIVELANGFKSGEQLSQLALFSMNKDIKEFVHISRLTQIAQRIGMVLGQSRQDGFTEVKGKVYDLSFNTERKDLTIQQKNGDIVLGVQSGKVHTSRVTPEIIKTFEGANSLLDKTYSSYQAQSREIHR